MITEKDGYVVVNIRVVSRASRSEIVGAHDGSLRVRISAPPVDGIANAEVIRLLAKRLGRSRSDIAIVAGLASKAKRLRINGVTAAEVRERLGV